MTITNDLQTAYDNLNSKQGEVLSDTTFNFFEDLNFLFNWDWFLVISECHTEDMSKLENSGTFLDEILADFVQNLCKEFFMVVQSKGKHKLGLEAIPNLMVLILGYL